MTLQELRDKLSRLRESGANANRYLCEVWICEYLSDKEEISRSIFNEIKKYIRMIYYEPFCGKVFVNFLDENTNLMEHFVEIEKASLRNPILLIKDTSKESLGSAHEYTDKVCYFDYKDGEKLRRRVKVKDD